MNAEHLATAAKRRTDGAERGGCIVLAVLTGLLLTPAAAFAAGEGKPVKLESIAGSTVKRITLTEKAAPRLGIETGKVDEELIERKQVVGGVFIVPPPGSPGAPPSVSASGPQQRSASASPATGDGGATLAAFAVPRSAAPPLPTGDGLVRVMFSPHEWERAAKDQPVRIFRLASRGERDAAVLARPSGTPPIEDLKRSMLTYFYVIDGKSHGLAPNERVRVELPLVNSGDKRKIVPYSAVYYDAKGDAWVYLNPKPLVYERRQIKVDQIIGDKAALLDGPEIGTAVVTVGAPLLFGTEVYGK
jgi:hypothetical protein